ncbi:RHS repeat domain-containing protein [Acidovorax sp. NCPPB 4044]|uniref:RHS repeat domain-containing protein n=1 Tax=Acidovorax sp. NCPPB 4044 TaxID=2940490 RepID=UPI002304CEF0|nr:hypothetical protein [Acidovorax sp. NCPPB 4044]MDA8521010.1 hypothetical protein [Acidovorax sp. NCPPB 4044]
MPHAADFITFFAINWIANSTCLTGNVVLSGQETAKDTGADAGASGPAASLAYQMRYRYDALGRKVGQSDAAGTNQAWTYDTFGRLIGRTESKTGGGTVDSTYAYDRAGGLVHEGNGAGKNIDYRYDGAGQLIEIRDNALGQTTSYSYDLAGNRVAEKLAQKTLLSSGVLDNVVYQDNHLVYDAQHRLRAVFDGRADVLSACPEHPGCLKTRHFSKCLVQSFSRFDLPSGRINSCQRQILCI